MPLRFGLLDKALDSLVESINHGIQSHAQPVQPVCTSTPVDEERDISRPEEFALEEEWARLQQSEAFA